MNGIQIFGTILASKTENNYTCRINLTENCGYGQLGDGDWATDS